MKVDLKYLNAADILVWANASVLQKIHDTFNGDWERAWHSDLSRFTPKERDADGKLIAIDYRKLKQLIDPDEEWQKLGKEKIGIVTILDGDYPKPLRHIPDPPFALYVRGSRGAWQKDCFAVVGTRALSEYGKRGTPHIVLDLARAGFVIVSGLAAGIDTLAHKAAIEAGAKTIAVLGCGADDRTIFPPQNLKLAHKIIETEGAVISEYPVGTHGTRFTFPQRNRIISGLSRGVLVIEGDKTSGAIITAKCAVEQNRDVFAVPGSIFAATSRGTNSIIKEGAKPVTCADDILEEYGLESEKAKKIVKADGPEEEKILTALTSEPMTADDIIRKTGLDAPQVNATLMIMELGKKIKNLGGGKFVLYE